MQKVDAKEVAKKHKIKYYECSSKTGEGLEEVFSSIFDLAILHKFKMSADLINNISDFVSSGAVSKVPSSASSSDFVNPNTQINHSDSVKSFGIVIESSSASS